MTSRILLIDDSANDLAVTRRHLQRRGYEVVTALDGEEGLRIAAENQPDAIIVDYRMPIMDGMEVTRRAKGDPRLQNIPVLMLTGSEAPQNVVEGLGAGADDYVTKGSEAEVVIARLSALLRVKAYQDELRRMNERMLRDLTIARRVQEALVPGGSFTSDRIEIKSAYIPSEALSGDFYDYFSVDSTTFLFVADVSGHGLPSAILVSLLKSYIHTEADPERSLAEFMSSLNDFLFSVSLPTQFATAQLFRIGADRSLTFSSAAHPPFLLFRSRERKVEVWEQPGNLLGAMPQMPFDEHALTVETGDTIFVYTDGLTDRRSPAGEFYSLDRVAAVLEASADAPLDDLYARLFEDVSNFATTEEFRDDIAFVVARFR